MNAPRLRDLNLEVASQLSDMALVHPAVYGRIAYKRAAEAILGLPEPLDAFIAHGELRQIPAIGHASARIILECLRHGDSPTVDRAIERASRGEEVGAARGLRKNFLSRAAALQALRSRRKNAVQLAEYRGDLQMHSDWSDGADTIAELARRAMARKYQYIAVTDHSYGLKIARGMNMKDAARRHREIDGLNAAFKGSFRVLKGIEANIPAAGGVDMTGAELSAFEVVLAAPHSRLRRAEDQTARMLAAVRHPRVHILAHPRGRMFARRGVIADWDRVFAEASRRDVAVELDGDPNRQDLDFTLARRALDAGCVFALDSDAHGGDELVYCEFALAHARLAGIPPARILNTWPLEKLLAWLRAKAPRR